MLSENIRNLRKAKGISQEELAVKLNVVRQTVSKWEKGLSVPDAEMLIRIAEELDTTVNVLLGESVEVCDTSEIRALSAKLELLNEQFAKHNEKKRKMWRIIFIILGVIALCSVSKIIAEQIYFLKIMAEMNSNVGVGIIGGADRPTYIYISNASFEIINILGSILLAGLSVFGIYRTKRR